ncbi:MAG: Tyrosine--tRNA ligase [Candidatus Saccharibacteria bacterium]|nr:Tyrosine--tRNA ligase [Candidatus Saccharibacteria bacterium]MDB5181205.1 Tyrosine--tRNA ligase [Candidatus Saccharibacteria bacterium]
MTVNTDPLAIEEILTRSIAEVIPTKEGLREQLLSGRRLSFYVGIDPTADYVHLGHSTNYLLMERLHALGHKIIVLVGDFTAMIGDPSDKTSMRVQLTPEEVLVNLKSFKQQIGKILNFEDTVNPIEFKFNSEWLSKLTFAEIVELASNFTVQQMVDRDAFKKRIAAEKPLYVHEFFYPLMQGYDSVALEVDVEIGGTDQTFNMLAGRTLLKRLKNKEKFVIATTLLENPITGEKLMSKSLGTGVGLDETPWSMFIKTMQLADAGIIQVFIDCTRLSLEEVDSYRKRLADGENPRDVKLALATEIVRMYHGEEASKKARSDWISEVSQKMISDDIQSLTVSTPLNLIDTIVTAKIVDSRGAARRLVAQGAVRINDIRIEPESEVVSVQNGDILKIGKKHSFKLDVE